MKYSISILAIIVILFSGHSSAQECEWDHGTTTKFLTKIGCPDDFNILQVSNFKEGHSIWSIKVSYQISTQNMFFIDTKNYFTHYEFCRENLNYAGSHSYYNQTEYTINPKRSYYNFILSYIEDLDIYTFEFFPDDRVPAKALLEIYRALYSRVYFPEKLRFLPTFYDYNTDAFKGVLPAISLSEIYNYEYSVLNEGNGVGVLRNYEEGVENDPLTILLTDIITNDLPPVAGVISTSYQPPLSHINILCKSRGIPNISISQGFARTSLDRLIGEWVYMEAIDNKYSVRPASDDEISAAKKQNSPVIITLNAILDSCKLYPVKDLSLQSASFVGRKAACFAELSKVSITDVEKIQVPEHGFAIPFHFYNSHIHEYGIDKMINSLLADSIGLSDMNHVRDKLSEIRKQILQSPLDSELLKLLNDYFVKEGIIGQPLRFRSSSNAEDALFFSGAGLYDSKTGIPGDTVKTVDNAIKTVWASLWNDRAFWERKRYGIDQNLVLMGILVHRSFPDEQANGVAISGGSSDCVENGFYLNIRSGEKSVVRPEEGSGCDEIYMCMSNTGWQVKAVKEETPGAGLVMSEEQLKELADKLLAIRDYFLPIFNRSENSLNILLDIEFKLDKNGKLYFKQVRPLVSAPLDY